MKNKPDMQYNTDYDLDEYIFYLGVNNKLTKESPLFKIIKDIFTFINNMNKDILERIISIYDTAYNKDTVYFVFLVSSTLKFYDYTSIVGIINNNINLNVLTESEDLIKFYIDLYKEINHLNSKKIQNIKIFNTVIKNKYEIYVSNDLINFNTNINDFISAMQIHGSIKDICLQFIHADVKTKPIDKVKLLNEKSDVLYIILFDIITKIIKELDAIRSQEIGFILNEFRSDYLDIDFSILEQQVKNSIFLDQRNLCVELAALITQTFMTNKTINSLYDLSYIETILNTKARSFLYLTDTYITENTGYGIKDKSIIYNKILSTLCLLNKPVISDLEFKIKNNRKIKNIIKLL